MSSLETVRERGFYEVVRESSGPYVGAVWNNFASDKETWTEQLVNGKLLNKATTLVGSLIGGKIKTPEPMPSAADVAELRPTTGTVAPKIDPADLDPKAKL